MENGFAKLSLVVTGTRELIEFVLFEHEESAFDARCGLIKCVLAIDIPTESPLIEPLTRFLYGEK